MTRKRELGETHRMGLVGASFSFGETSLQLVVSQLGRACCGA
jgi:hypothetical protein